MYFAFNAFHFPLLFFIVAMFALCVALYLKIKELQKQRELQSLIISASIGGHYLWADNGLFSRPSPSLISMLSLDSNECEFIAIAKLFGDKANIILNNFENLKEGKIENFQFIGKIQTPNYNKEILCNGCSIIDEGSFKVKGVVVWFFDISEYSQEIRQLNSQNTQLALEIREYSRIFNTIPIPIWKRDNNLKIKFCNSVYNQFVDNDNNIAESGIPELDQSLKHLSSIAKDNHKPLSMKKHIIINGERKFYNINEVSIKNNGGTLGFAYDITDQDEVEKALARYIAANTDLIENSSNAMAIYSADTKLRVYNNAFVHLWGLKVKWLDNNPTYSEVLYALKDKLPVQSNFDRFRKEQMRKFQDVTKTHEELIHLPNGKSLRNIVIQHALGGLLFVYEEITEKLRKDSL